MLDFTYSSVPSMQYTLLGLRGQFLCFLRKLVEEGHSGGG